MPRKIINTATPNSGNGDTLYTAFGKVNDNFSELYTIYNIVTATVATVTPTQISSFPKTFLGAKLIIQASNTATGKVQMSELLLAHNGSITTITQVSVALVGTTIASYSAEISGSNVIVKATSTSTSSTFYKIIETLL